MVGTTGGINCKWVSRTPTPAEGWHPVVITIPSSASSACTKWRVCSSIPIEYQSTCTSWFRHLLQRDRTLQYFVVLWEVLGSIHCVRTVFHPYTHKTSAWIATRTWWGILQHWLQRGIHQTSFPWWRQLCQRGWDAGWSCMREDGTTETPAKRWLYDSAPTPQEERASSELSQRDWRQAQKGKEREKEMKKFTPWYISNWY